MKQWTYILFTISLWRPKVRGEFNQECESIHKIRMNKVTDVSNSVRNVLMLSFDSSIRKSAETKTQSVADN